MDTTIDYDTVKTLVANPPNLDPRPNFFNLRVSCHGPQTYVGSKEVYIELYSYIGTFGAS